MTDPHSNPNLVGHEAAEAALLAAVQSGRLHHGWLITGPEGIGKATLAYRFARYLMAGGKGDSLQLSADHPVFKRMAASGHADLVVVERSANDRGALRQEIVVDDVRRIEPMFRRTSAEGGWRIAIIDQADRMNENAQNAVLKLLEEPPTGALLLLTASAPGRLLPTIRSRVRTLALEPLSPPVLADLLRDHLPDLSENDRLQLAAMAEGSLGQSLALHEAEGLTVYRELLAILNALDRLPASTLLDYVEKLGQKEASPGYEVITRLLPQWLANVAKMAATGHVNERIEGEAAPMAMLASTLGLERSLALWEKVRELFSQAEGLNLDRKQTLLSALLAIKGAPAI